MLPGGVDGDGPNTVRILAVEGLELLGGHVVSLVLVTGHVDDDVVRQEVHVIALVGIVAKHGVE